MNPNFPPITCTNAGTGNNDTLVWEEGDDNGVLNLLTGLLKKAMAVPIYVDGVIKKNSITGKKTLRFLTEP